MPTLTVNYTLNPGSNLRIGYKTVSSSNPYVYLPYFPSFNQSPYTFEVPTGTYQLELTTVCNSCSGNQYSDPVFVTQQAMG